MEAELALVAVDEEGGDAFAHGVNGTISISSASPCRGESSGIGELNHASAVDECVDVKGNRSRENHFGEFRKNNKTMILHITQAFRESYDRES